MERAAAARKMNEAEMMLRKVRAKAVKKRGDADR
jgi:hypothetical protein